ncbi:MAG TPA: response regulator transcription factor [Thiobacillaceae bacterium]|nr:response regulator transcription factor [Thiobacillaceae bacterium]
MRILLTEDDSALADLLTRACKQEGYSVDWVSDGVAADLALTTESYDALLLDLGLPRMEGLEVLRRLRRRGSRLPVMILTARDAIADRVAGLDCGADDYLPKPFAVAELQARLRALVRRHHGGAASARLELGKLSFDTSTRQVFLEGREVEFSSREREVLSTLVHRAGKVISKHALTAAMSSWDASIGSNAVEVYIHRLRKKLEPEGIYIRTVRGLGYLIEASDDRPD